MNNLLESLVGHGNDDQSAGARVLPQIEIAGGNNQ